MTTDDACYGLGPHELEAAEQFAKFSPAPDSKYRMPWSEGFWTALTAVFGDDERRAERVVDCGRKIETALVNMR